MFADRFDERARRRGVDYFCGGFATIEHSRPGFVEASVCGTSTYTVLLSWADESGGPGVPWIEGSCSCPAFEQFGPCKHLWAVVLEADAAGLAPPAVSPWRGRLDDLRRMAPQLGNGSTWSLVPASAFQLRYIVDVEDTVESGQLVLRTFGRRRLKSGKWGVERDYCPEARDADPLTDPLDRRIFASLCGAPRSRHRPGWYTPGYGSNEFTLGRELCGQLLPLLGETGRLHWWRQGAAGGPLAWDGGEPWVLRVGVREDRDERVLEGFLERGDELVGLDAPLLILGMGYVFLGDTVARFDAREAMLLVVELRTRGPLRVPVEHASELVSTLALLPGGVVEDLEGVSWAEPAPPRPCLLVEPTDRPRTLDCQIAFDYDGARVDPRDPAWTLQHDRDGLLVRRDREAETAALQRFIECGGRWDAADDLHGRHGTVVTGRLGELASSLLAEGWSVEAEGVPWRRSGSFRVSVSSNVDWFDLEGGLEFDDQVAPFPALLEALRERRNTVRLGDGSVGVLPERWLDGWGLLDVSGEVDGDRVRFAHHQGWLLDALLAEKEGVRADEGFERFRRGLQGFRGISPRVEPAGFRGVLRPYQREGLGWFEFLSQLGLGGCLADDMGLGKTVQVLALLEQRRGSSVPASLVVAPRSLVFNWIDEAARFTPRLRVLDYTGPDRKQRLELGGVDLVVTTYGTLRRDVLELKDRRFDYVVLDEATAIKNAASQSAKAARLLTADHRLALSGTPIENHLGELWSLFEFLNPGMLGRSRAFKGFVSHSGDGSREGLELLARALRPFFLRRTKGEVASDLPKKTEQTIHFELKSSERKGYDQLREHYRTALLAREQDVGLERMKIQVLEALLRLRQTACHPGLMDESRRAESSAKLDTLLPMLREIAAEGHKALVFSQFTKLLGIVRERLDQLGLRYEYLDGRTRKRKEKVERFQSDSSCPLFLISIKAGGHGLNLTAADYVFVLDPWWNPAVEAQAIDRAHRIGRTRPVMAYRLIARETVEEKVLELQTSKRELAETLLGAGRGVLKDLTREELERLLS